ncbi:MAG: isocitrate/isopropylmalate family dehydrogenase, partial [Clostridiaceae bacterium]
VRPIKSFDGVDSLYKDIDMVIVRENTEDLYKGIEYMATPDVAESIKVITRDASERIAEFAYQYALNNKRHKVTTSHKANIMKLSDGLFLESSRKVGRKFPDIVTDDVIIDAMCMKLVMKPMDFDIILAPNLYGDILSDLAAGLIGGIGMAPSVNIGEDTAIFEPVHGSAPDIAGKGIANPTAAILSGIMLLRHINLMDEADKLENAITKVLADKSLHTSDLGGTLTTVQFTESIKKRL